MPTFFVKLFRLYFILAGAFHVDFYLVEVHLHVFVWYLLQIVQLIGNLLHMIRFYFLAKHALAQSYVLLLAVLVQKLIGSFYELADFLYLLFVHVALVSLGPELFLWELL